MKNSQPLKAVFPGKYIQTENALAMLPELVGLLGNNALILASPTTKSKILPDYHSIIAEKRLRVEEFRGECCENELQRIEEIIGRNRTDVMVGMGGGKTIDAAKIAADRAGIPVIIVPTIASTDAPCSGCAVIYSDTGEFQSVYYQKLNPQVVLVDVNVIVEAPARFLVAGMGDALATWFEARSCNQTHSPNACGGYSTLAGLALAKLCYDTLLADGAKALKDIKNRMITPALNHIIEANILLSGLGFESSGLAAAHSVHNGLTALEETHLFYHGEKVAFGVVTGLHLNDALPAEKETVYSFCESIGLPTTFNQVGIRDVSREKLMKVAIKSCAPEECIHHERGPITPERVLDAMIAADAFGKARMNQ
jgi:glycerol dehydrogenase